jgi:general secretion pathway protein A
MTPKHEEALCNLEYGISSRTGITLLVGEAGTGKTTLIRNLLAPYMQPPAVNRARWVYLNHPTLSQQEFLECLAHGFQLGPDAAGSKPRFLRALERILAECRENGIVTALVIDEAQSLSHELLEEVRLLANIESDTEKLLAVVLAGQPALADRLNEPQLGQLKQRVALRCVLPPLNLRETAFYIAHRISLSGGNPAQLFSRDAVSVIYERSRGIPRTINVICDNALLSGFAADAQPVGAEIVLEVCRDFDLKACALAGGSRSLVPRPDVAEDPLTPRCDSFVAHARGVGFDVSAARGHKASF